MMHKEAILKALRDSGTPMTIEELSSRTGVDVVRLRVDLFRLMSEGKVEKRVSGNTTVWTINVRSKQ